MKRQERQIIEASTIISMDGPTDQDKAFLARQLVQTTMPHSDPGNVPVWSRANGNVTLSIQQGYRDDGTPYGHPYGTLPRLLMYWMTTEAIRTKTPKLQLGDSLGEFMDELGLDASRGGKRSDAARLKDQMARLFEARISFTTQIEQDGLTGQERDRMQVAEKTLLWWDQKNPGQRTLWGSYVQLDPRFYEAITANPVPVDLRALRAIKRSPLALDLYSLLTYQAFRASKADRPRFMSWKQLQAALGTGYTDHTDLRKAVKGAMRNIEAVYPGLMIGERAGGIEVLPESLPAISPRAALR
ncbi:replication protein RepA [Caballeronia sp. AZ7_KS35]|uniref:replication protein RepA n=1 Tax=Caballeronia sp. AZ7_KS35 TaxID=2921762 RepID=UPI002029140C|nr:replication protein RepA [Caballeronia sp. AZ7_KS35]